MDNEIDCKRFYIPGVVLKEKCPKCGKVVEKDLHHDEYLSYPEVGINNIDFYHDDEDCEHEWTVPYTLKITLEKIKAK